METELIDMYQETITRLTHMKTNTATFIKNHLNNLFNNQLNDTIKSCLHKINLLINEYYKGTNTLYAVIESEDSIPPTRNGHSAGYDLYVAEEIFLPFNEAKKIRTKLSLKGSMLIKDNIFGLILGRSSTYTQLNINIFPGVIDSDYTGELIIQGMSFCQDGTLLPRGTKVAQIIFLPYFPMEIIIQNENSDIIQATETIASWTRGINGFGSSGMRRIA